MDGTQVLVIASALAEGKSATIEFFLPRMREDLRVVVQAWLDMDPLHNKDAPPHPLAMTQYKETILKKFEIRRAKLQEDFQKSMREAEASGSYSDNYVLLTVLFATVLFFAGIASTFHSPRVEKALLLVATMILSITMAMLVTFPITFS